MKTRLRWLLFVWALPSAGTTAMLWLVMVYLLKFSNDVLGVGPAVVGALFGLGRLWDAVSDPAVGFLSDRTTTRIGRRRPWIAAAALPTAVAFVALWSPPAALSGAALVVWLGVALLLLYTGLTAFQIPHASLGAELTEDHHARTGIFALRNGLESVGILIAIGCLAMLENASAPREAARSVAIGLALVSAVWMVGSALLLAERREHQGRGAQHPYRAFRDVWRNEHARQLFAVFFLSELGLASLAAAVPYVSGTMMGGDGMSGWILLAFLAPALISIPLWLPVARRLGKRNTWLLAAVLATLAFAGISLFGPGDELAFFVLAGVIGLTQGATRTLPHSIKADVIDVDELRTGERKEGAYFAAWNFVQKAAAGFSIALMGVMLEVSGLAQGAPSEWGIRLVMSVMPALLVGGSALLLLGFRFGEAEHRAVRAQLGGARGGVLVG